MASSKIFLIVSIIILAVAIFWYFSQRSEEEMPSEELPIAGQEQGLLPAQPINMKIESPAFKNNENIPAKYTCDGQDVNPALKISEVPEGAKSLVLIVDDPDAPMGTWVHWTVWNIATSTSEITENSVPEAAIEGLTDFGKPGWGGPCPPSGTHRYFFKLFALDMTLDLDSSAKIEDLETEMQGRILAQAELIGLYQRK